MANVEPAKLQYQESTKRSEFNVSSIPFHIHNNSDSPRVNFTNIANKFTTISFTLFGTQAATAGNYSVFFTAPVSMTVTGITEVHTVLGTDGSAVTLQIEKLIGTTAPGSGVSLLTTAFNLKGTINTVVSGVITPTVGFAQLSVGDRLALKLTGTPTSVANVTVTLVLNF